MEENSWKSESFVKNNLANDVLAATSSCFILWDTSLGQSWKDADTQFMQGKYLCFQFAIGRDSSF